MHCGSQAKEQSGKQGDAKSESEYPPIGVDVELDREVDGSVPVAD
jgi:hypothetical protein